MQRASDQNMFKPMTQNEMDEIAQIETRKWFVDKARQEAKTQVQAWYHAFSGSIRQMARPFPECHIRKFEERFPTYNLTEIFGLNPKSGLSNFLSFYPNDPKYLQPLEWDASGNPVRSKDGLMTRALTLILASNPPFPQVFVSFALTPCHVKMRTSNRDIMFLMQGLHKAIRTLTGRSAEEISLSIKNGSVLDEPLRMHLSIELQVQSRGKNFVALRLSRELQMQSHGKAIAALEEKHANPHWLEETVKAAQGLENEWAYQDFERTVLNALPALHPSNPVQIPR